MRRIMTTLKSDLPANDPPQPNDTYYSEDEEEDDEDEDEDEDEW
jgi:hypothetical protein